MTAAKNLHLVSPGEQAIRILAHATCNHSIAAINSTNRLLETCSKGLNIRFTEHTSENPNHRHVNTGLTSVETMTPLQSSISKQVQRCVGGFSAFPAGAQQSNADAASIEMTMTPAVSLAPFHSRANTELKLLPASIQLTDHIFQDESQCATLEKMLNKLLALKSFLELDKFTILFDEFDSALGQQSIKKVTDMLAGLGKTPDEVFSIQECIEKLSLAPQDFGAILTLSPRGRWVEAIAQSMIGAEGLHAQGRVMPDLALYGCVQKSTYVTEKTNAENPNAYTLAAVMLLVDLGEHRAAAEVFNAWIRTVEDGIHTKNLLQFCPNARLVDTDGFADAIIDRLGKKPRKIIGLTGTQRQDASPLERRAGFRVV